MKQITIHSHYSDAPRPVSHNGGGRVVLETAGYIPKEVQLQMLLDSGVALERYRRELFPEMIPYDEEENLSYDPTISKGYDIFDCHADVVRVRDNLSRKAMEKELKDKEEQARVDKEKNAAKETPTDAPTVAAANAALPLVTPPTST